MNSTRAFRISTYLPLALATAALGYAEAPLLPEVGVFAVIVLLAFVVIYRMETQVRHLTLGEFNRLGACIGVAAVLWAGFRIIREIKTSEFAALGWTAFLVALVAPLLLAAVCALLLRQGKKPGDYWFIQAAGLAAIVLAGAMAEQAVLAVLTTVYALSVVWFLTEFHRVRSGENVERLPFWRPALFLGIAAVGAVPLYLLTPRSPFDKLEFGQGRIEIGYAADQMIDLTQTGELASNPETAFEFQAEKRDGQPKEDIDGETRWRGSVLVTYGGGTWKRDTQAQFPTNPSTKRKDGLWKPPELGSDAFKLTFTVPGKLRSTFLLDPVEWQTGEPESVVELTAGSTQPWPAVGNGRVFNLQRLDERERRYVQYSRPSAERDLSPAYPGTPDVNKVLLAMLVPSVKSYTDRVVDEAVAAGKLPPDAKVRDAVQLFPAEKYREAIARVLRDHLSARADLSYTTSLKRANRGVDPVEDFLLHSKAGHCERFATALVLMLRSQGIPAVMVLGFKGCEHTGNGKYIVRQEFAHAWAEALIARPDPKPERGSLGFHWHWLSLDPSPSQDRSTESGSASNAFNWSALERLIFRYTPEERERALKAIGNGLSSLEFIFGAVGIAALLFAVRFAWKRMRFAKRVVTTEWFQQLAVALEPRGITPGPGETAREFAVRAAGLLPDSLADVPVKWVELHYGERFGGEPPDPAAKLELEQRLQVMARFPEVRS